MKPSRIAVPFAVLLLAAAPASARGGAQTGVQAGTPVPLAPRPGTELDRAVRALVAQDLAEAARSGDAPLLLVGTAKLGAARDPAAVFVQLQSPRECGSAGCNTSVYVRGKQGWRKVLDGVGGEVRVARTRTRGMRDLLADTERYVWNGTAYVDTRPAPPVDLKPPARAQRH